MSNRLPTTCCSCGEPATAHYYEACKRINGEAFNELRVENARLFALLTRAFERIQAEDAASANGDESALAADIRAVVEGGEA